MRVTTLCLVCLISRLPSIRWTMMFWQSAWDPFDHARLASLIPLRPPTDDPLRRGLFYRPLSLLRCPSGLRTWAAAVPALHRRPGSACCQSRPVIPLLCRRLSALHVGPPATIAQQRHRIELGIERIAEWMRSNRLRLNPEKTDFMWCATRRRCMHLDTSELSVCGTLIRPSTTVRDLGVPAGV